MKVTSAVESVRMPNDTELGPVRAVMVTYYPDRHVADRILRWLEEVPVLYVIDNGSSDDSLRPIRNLAAQQRIVLVENRKNLGIAAALNQAVNIACCSGFEWLLTLDQDSMPMPGYVKQQFAALAACPFMHKVAIVGGRAIESSGCEKDRVAPTAAYGQWHTEKIVITSGSLCRCDTLLELGGFRTGLFIDLVDTEYCLRIGQHGLRVIVSDKSCFYHEFGVPRQYRIGPYRFTKHLYTPIRNYYRFRNGVRLSQEWWRYEPGWSLRRIVVLIRLAMNILLLHDRKSENLHMAFRGTLDALNHISGPIDEAVREKKR